MILRYSRCLYLALATASLHTTFLTVLSQQAGDKSGVKPSVISLPSGPGSIEGLGESFEPQLNTGASTYRVPLELPPGRNGLAPELALSYNSGLGNSFLGIGWNLEIPQIRRQTDKGFPEYHFRDTFIFRGEELVPLSNGDYRCENESGFQRFRVIDSNQDQKIDAWEMTEPNGTVHLFGRYRGEEGRWSAVVHPDAPDTAGESPHDRTYCWALDSTIDLHGNRVDYSYARGIGKLYPSQISYSHSKDNQVAHRIFFNYQSRDDNFDDYRPTFSSLIDRRLAEIVIGSGNSLVRRYRLDYQYAKGDLEPLPEIERIRRAGALDLGVSVLKRFVQLDSETNSDNYLPPLVFYYSFLNPELSIEALDVLTLPKSSDGLSQIDLVDGDHVQIADLNADGFPDLYATELFTGRQLIRLNEGPVELGAGIKTIRFGATQSARSSSSAEEASSPLRLNSPDVSLADYDGNGIIDLVEIEPGVSTSLTVYRNRTRLDVNSEAVLGFESNPDPGLSTIVEGAPAYFGFRDPSTRQVDLNFDKSSDFLHFDRLGKFQASFRDRHGEWIHRSFDPPLDLPSDFSFSVGETSNPRVKLADMNGDRLLDLVYLGREGLDFAGKLTVSYWPYCALGKWGGAEPSVIVRRTRLPWDGAN